MKITNIPSHVAIILDGNGRWAKKLGQPRSFGHYMGGRNLFTVAAAAKNMGLKSCQFMLFRRKIGKDPKMKYPI